MLLSLQWLREFTPFEGTAEELGDRLTMSGLELEGINRPFAGLRPIVVGHVVECGRHPEADKLSVTRVDVGDEVLDIVCGAPNVAQGQKVAVVKAGCALPGGLTVKKAKLRGAPSHGMICSEAELGLSDDHDGILVLDPSAPAGARLLDVLALDEEVLDIAVTPNRGDCLSVLGLARETAALYRLPLTLPKAECIESGDEAAKELRIETPDGALCFLYSGRIIENVVIRPAPGRMRRRLRAVGIRAVSNVVDVTNYILMEVGQPLHAFDLDAVRGGKIIVRGADPHEPLVTLDGQTRKLLPTDVTIRDAERSVGLGGVMGGLNSEITDTSTRVFLECAVFNPSSIRKTARRLALNSDAAYRFERGVDQTAARYALDRAAALMAALSGGSVRKGILYAEPAPWKAPSIVLNKHRAEKLLGIPLDAGFCVDTLTRLGCSVTAAGPDAPEQDQWRVAAPGHRPDLTREADLIEEIVRMYGVDRIEPVIPPIVRPLEDAGKPLPAQAFRAKLKHWAAGMGLNESVNYSFTGHKDLDLFPFPQGAEPGRISILNPLSEELNVLRTLPAPGLMNTLRNNLAQGATGVRIFELAVVFAADAASPTTAREAQRLGLLFYGNRYDGAWPNEQGDMDYTDVRGSIDHLAKAFSLPAPEYALSGEADARPWLAPCVTVGIGGRAVGFAGKARPAVADPYHAKREVWTAELDVDALYALFLKSAPSFAPLDVFPPVRRDITVIAPTGVNAGDIIAAVEERKIPLLTDIRLIDCFEPKGKDERNLTYRLTFRHTSRTLKDAEADKQRDAAAAALLKRLPVRMQKN